MHVIIHLWLDHAKFPQNSSQIYDNRQGEGCALAEPSGPWHLTFEPGQLENLTFFIQIICYAGHSGFHSFRAMGPINVS